MKSKQVVSYPRNRCKGDDAIMCDFCIVDPNMATETVEYAMHFERDEDGLARMAEQIAIWVGSV